LVRRQDRQGRHLPINAQLGAYYNLIHPRDLPYGKWQVRMQVAMLFPKSN